MFTEDQVRADRIMYTRPVVAAPDDRVFDITQRLLAHGHRAAPVLDAQRHLLGLITERDCVKALIGAVHHQWPPSQVRDVMTTDVISTRADATLMEVAHLFYKHSVSMLPVMDGPRCVGIITRGECLARAVKVFRKAGSRGQAILYLSALERDAPV